MTATSNPDGKKLNITCPHCGQGIEIAVGQVERGGKAACGSCGVASKLDSHQFRAGLRLVEKLTRHLWRQVAHQARQPQQASPAPAPATLLNLQERAQRLIDGVEP